MDNDSNKIIWTVITIAVLVIIGTFSLNFLYPNLMVDAKGYISNVLDNFDNGLSKNSTDDDENSRFIYTYDNSNSEATIVGYKFGADNLEPSTINIPKYRVHDGTKYTVTAIGNSAFLDSSDTDHGIGYYYYKKHNQRINLTFPDSIQSIGNKAFQTAYVKTVDLSGDTDLTYIGNSAFMAANEDHVIFPSKKTNDTGIHIDSSAFSTNTSLQDINITPAVVALSSGSFAQDFNTTSITIDAPELKGIPERAFASNYNVKSLTFKDSNMVSIGDYSFEELGNNIDGTIDIDIPEGVTYLGERSFGDMNGVLHKVTIPSTITQIDDQAFFFSLSDSSTVTIKRASSSFSMGNSVFVYLSGTSTVKSITPTYTN